MDLINLVIAFNLGLLSSFHCVVMCGGIIGSLSVLPGQNTQNRKYKTLYIIFYNIGRITSYCVAGFIAASFGYGLIENIFPADGHQILQILSGIVLVLIGLQVAGVYGNFKFIERSGLFIWRYIQPLGKSFLPVTRIDQAMIIGLIWGWLPCALVYSVLLWAVTLGNPVTGILVMLFFGLGTLPSMITVGMIGHRLTGVFRDRKVRMLAGAMIICIGILSLFFNHPISHHHNM